MSLAEQDRGGKTDSHILTHNSTILLARAVCVWALGMALVIFLPRYLGDQGLGQLQFAQSFVSLFAVLGGLGIGRYLIKEIARDRSQLAKYIGSALGIQGLMAFVIIALIAVITELSGHSDTARYVIYILGVWLLMISFARLMGAFLHGFEAMGRTSVAEVANKAFVAVVGITVLLSGGGVLAFAGVMVGGAIIQYLLNAHAVARIAPLRIDFNRERMRTLVIGGMPFLMLGFILNVYVHVDVVMLGFLTDESVVGWHAAAFRIFGSLEMLPAIITSALLPTLSRMYKAGSPHTGMLASRTLGAALLIMVPIGVGMSLTSRELITLLPYPDTFDNSIPILTLLALSTPVTAVLIIFGSMAAAADKQVFWAWALGGTLVLNVLINLVAIPYFQDGYGNGAIGAALATLVTESFMILVGFWIVPKVLFTRHLAMITGKIAVCAGLMTLAVLWGKSFDLGLFPLVGIGAVTYGTLAFVSRAITPQDIRFLASSVASRKGKDMTADQ